MTNITITKTIVQPTEVIESFADRKGYMSEIHNPAYVVEIDEDGNMTNNGEAVTLTNPQTKQEYVSELFDEFVAKEFFGVFATEDAKKQKMAEAKAAADATVEAIKATISTT